jgi:hypothetical protein
VPPLHDLTPEQEDRRSHRSTPPKLIQEDLTDVGRLCRLPAPVKLRVRTASVASPAPPPRCLGAPPPPGGLDLSRWILSRRPRLNQTYPFAYFKSRPFTAEPTTQIDPAHRRPAHCACRPGPPAHGPIPWVFP